MQLIQLFLLNPVFIFRNIMSPQILNITVRETSRRAEEVIQALNKVNLTCTPLDKTEIYPLWGLLLFSGVLHYNYIQVKICVISALCYIQCNNFIGLQDLEISMWHHLSEATYSPSRFLLLWAKEVGYLTIITLWVDSNIFTASLSKN